MTRPVPGPPDSLTGNDLSVVPAAEALAFAKAKLAPLLQSSNPVVVQLFANEFHEDWQIEAGRWLRFAEEHGFLERVLKTLINVANAPPDSQNSHQDRFHRTFLAWFAEPMAAYFLCRSGWGFREWEPARFKPDGDVDFIVSSPGAEARDVLVQVKSPDVPGAIVDHRAQGGDNNAHVWAAIAGAQRPDGTRKRGAIGQLPSPAVTPAMIVVHAHRHGVLSQEPAAVEARLVGAVACYGFRIFELAREDCGVFFTQAWAHCGAVVLLDHMRSDEFRYPCTVYLNPNADPAARCEREWFRGARVCYLDGNTLRWQGGVPRYTSIPDGTPVVERAG